MQLHLLAMVLLKKSLLPKKAKIDTQYPYALTKYLGERLIIHWSKVYKLNCTSLRLFNVYGPRSRTSGTYGAMFGVFLAQKIANKPLLLWELEIRKEILHLFQML